MRIPTLVSMFLPAFMLLAGAASAQSNGHWTFLFKERAIATEQSMLGVLPSQYKLASLDVPALYEELSGVTREQNEAPFLVAIPSPEGGFAEFYISPTSVVSREAAHLYTVKTFKGYAKNAQQVTIRCDISPTGFHAVVFSGNITYAIEPASKSDVSTHIIYYKSDLKVPGVKCGVDGSHSKGRLALPAPGDTPKTPANLRTYRLAIIADATYRTQFGGMPYDATNVLNSMASGVNLNNEIFERDLGVTFTLVSNAACANAVLADHTNIDAVHTFIVNNSGLGSGGFDVGHSLLWSNTGGAAYRGVVCNNSFKGGGFSGVTGSFTQLFVDYVAHELGHQFGANHTFASQECGTSEPTFRYETGEGSTIMAYAGVCGSGPSYQNFSDPFFHAASIDEINSYLSASGSCAAISMPGTGNNAAPVANAQSDITIPRQTPFVLVGSAIDGNSDPVSFAWQQYNGSGTAVSGSPNCNSTTHPLFRFRVPVNDSYRVFPQMSDVLAGNNNTPAWEKLPCVARTMNFRLTVRDNNPNWGRTHADDMVVTVANTGPFNVTVPNGGESWVASSNQTVTWTVNGTDAHCANVDVLLSADNGVTYSVLGTFPNNGSASVTMPGTASTTARVLVQCSVGGNFRSASTFFDVSDAVFEIAPPPPPCTGLTAPGEVEITNSTCNAGCTVSGGMIQAPVMGCPTGSSIEYNVNNGGWSTALPTYATNGSAQTIQTRCICDEDDTVFSQPSAGVTTAPGTCVTPTAPTLNIVNNTCPSTPGTIAATGCGAGTVTEYATDVSGPWSTIAPAYTTTAFTVYARCRDEANGCISGVSSEDTQPESCITISGNIAWEHNQNIPVPNVTVTLSGDDTGSDATDMAGDYEIPTTGGDLTVTPTKQLQSRQGVDAADVTRIRQHVLATMPFTSPYKRIAADVNQSNSITNADAAIIQQALLNNVTAGTILDNPAWRFVEADHVFPNPTMPWGFPAFVNLTNVAADVSGVDFIGVKIGDVNGTWAMMPSLSAPPLTWQVADQWLEAGRSIRVPFAVQANMADVAAWQFALRFDPAQVALGQVIPRTAVPLTREEFGFSGVLDGELRSVFAVAEGVAVKAGEVAFELELHVRRGGMRLSEVLRLDDAALEGRVYDTDLNGGAVKLAFAPVRDKPGLAGVAAYHEAAFELYQNVPNPFADETMIAFNLPTDAAAVITIQDASGREVAQLTGDYAAGYNSVQLTREVLRGASGVLSYTVTAGAYTATRRMVLVK